MLLESWLRSPRSSDSLLKGCELQGSWWLGYDRQGRRIMLLTWLEGLRKDRYHGEFIAEASFVPAAYP
jgi:hypothetical protein